MNLMQTRAIAWVVLAFGLVIAPLAKGSPPASEPVHTTKVKTTGTTTGKATGTTVSNPAHSTNGTNEANGFPVSGASIVSTPKGTQSANTATAHPTAGSTTSQTAATRTTTGTISGQAATGNTGNTVNTTINPLEVLREARHLVGSVPYTYDGHRTQANRDIEEAIHKLTPPKTNTNASPQTHNSIAPAISHSSGHSSSHASNGTATAQTHVLSQAEADARLQQAMKLLNVVSARIQTENAAAAVDVEAAVAELKLALARD